MFIDNNCLPRMGSVIRPYRVSVVMEIAYFASIIKKSINPVVQPMWPCDNIKRMYVCTTYRSNIVPGPIDRTQRGDIIFLIIIVPVVCTVRGAIRTHKMRNGVNYWSRPRTSTIHPAPVLCTMVAIIYIASYKKFTKYAHSHAYSSDWCTYEHAHTCVAS